MSSFVFNGQKMMHAAVNTDPLHLSEQEKRHEKHYGLKERNIPHMKINEKNDLKVWYEFGEIIGRGAFGTVIAVVEKGTNKPWAIKSVTKKFGEKMKLIQREVQVLKMIQHPHIIFLDKIFESMKTVYMIFEKCKRDFAEVYEEQKPFNEKIAKKIINDLVEAVAYLHKYDIVHRDIKMENILLGENPDDPSDEYYIKLTDFGLAVIKTSGSVASMLHDYCGTLTYMAPEVITVRSYSQTCDMWSIGVILYMLIEGKYPFYSSNEKQLQNLICTSDPTFEDLKLSHEVKDLILSLLMKTPVNRITATETLQHPWLLNTKLSINGRHSHNNIFDKMKKWKSEMKVETGSASDWTVSESKESVERRHSNKQPMNLPKTNINFDRLFVCRSRRDSREKRMSRDRGKNHK